MADENYFVDQAGNDGAAGTVGVPWRSLQRAFDELEDGDTLTVSGDTWTLGLIAQDPEGGEFTDLGGTYETDSIDFEAGGVAANDYLWTEDPDGTYRSFKIAAISGGTLTLSESASGNGVVEVAAFGCAPANMPSLEIVCAATADNTETEIVITFDGTVINANNANLSSVIKLDDCDNVWLLGDLKIYDGGTSCAGIWINASGASASKSIVIEGVEVYGCQDGILGDAQARSTVISKCHLHNNDRYGAYLWGGYGCSVINCEINDNVNHGIYFAGYTLPATAIGNLIYGNANGIYFGTTANRCFVIADNAIYDNDTYGVKFDTDFVTDNYRTNLLLNNIIWGNGTTDIFTSSTETCIGVQQNNYFETKSADIHLDDTDIQSANDPGFWDAANGDFRLHLWSPCINTGYAPSGGYANIGAMGTKIPLNVLRNRRIGFYGLTNADFGL